MTFKLAPLPFLLMMMGTAWEAQADMARPVLMPAPFPMSSGTSGLLQGQTYFPARNWPVLQPGNASAPIQIAQARPAQRVDRLNLVSHDTIALDAAGDEAGAPSAPEATVAAPNVTPAAQARTPSPNLANPPMEAGMATPGSVAAPTNRMAMPPGFMMPMMVPMGFMPPALRSGPSFTPNFPAMNPAMAMPQPALRLIAPMPGLTAMPRFIPMPPSPIQPMGLPRTWPTLPMGIPPQWATIRYPGLPAPVMPTVPQLPPAGMFPSYPPALAARPSGYMNGLSMLPAPTMPLPPYPQPGVHGPNYPVTWAIQVRPPAMGMPMMVPQSWGPMAGIPRPMPMQVPPPVANGRMPAMPGLNPQQIATMMMAQRAAGFMPPVTIPAMAVPNRPVPWFMPWIMVIRSPVQPAVATSNPVATSDEARTADTMTSPALPDALPASVSTTIAPAELSAPAEPNDVLPQPALPSKQVKATTETAVQQDAQPEPVIVEPEQPMPQATVLEVPAAALPTPVSQSSATNATQRASAEPDPCSKSFRRIKSRVQATKHAMNASWHRKSRYTPCGDQGKSMKQVKHIVKARPKFAMSKDSAIVKVRANHRVCFDKGHFSKC
jgi:hypothetical protein